MSGRLFSRLLVAARPLMSRVSQPSNRHIISRTYDRTSLPASSFHTSHCKFNANVFNVQDTDDFDARVLKSSTPVVIDFHATWCGPCKLLGPRLESLISERDGKVVLAKIDIDELQELAIDHGVEAVPTVLGMKDGKVVDKFVGLKDDADLQSFIDKLSG